LKSKEKMERIKCTLARFTKLLALKLIYKGLVNKALLILQCNKIESIYRLYSKDSKTSHYHGTIEPFETNIYWSNKHETP